MRTLIARTRRLLLTLASVSLVSVLAAAPVAAAPGWSGPSRVLADVSPLSPSVVLTGGVFHVAYFHDGFGNDEPSGIFYASNAGGTWHKERVTTGDTFFARPSLAVDADGKVSIAFGRFCCDPVPTTSSIWIATNRTGPWVLGQRTRDAQDGAPSLRFAGGALHLAFARTGVGVIFQSKASGSWVSSTVVSTAGACYIEQFPSLAMDAAGKAWVAYEQPRFGGCASGGSSSNGIRVATNTAGSWVAQTIAASVNDAQPDLAMGRTGQPHLIFERSGSGVLYTQRDANGTWTTKNFAADGGDASLAVDGNGKAHVALEGAGPAYATNRSGTWVTTPLASYGLDYGTNSPVRIVLSNTGKARVLFARTEGASEDDLGLFLAKEL